MRDEIKALPKIEGVKEIFMPGEPEFNNRKRTFPQLEFMMPEVVVIRKFKNLLRSLIKLISNIA
jgi:hypothetical protein